MPVVVWTSTLQRTIQTAEQLPFPKLRWKVLDEIQAGIFDGWTYAEIEMNRPEEFAARKRDKLSYRWGKRTLHLRSPTCVSAGLAGWLPAAGTPAVSRTWMSLLAWRQ